MTITRNAVTAPILAAFGVHAAEGGSAHAGDAVTDGNIIGRFISVTFDPSEYGWGSLGRAVSIQIEWPA